MLSFKKQPLLLVKNREIGKKTHPKPCLLENNWLLSREVGVELQKEVLRQVEEEERGYGKNYTSTLDNAVRMWFNKIVDVHADSLFSYTTSEDVRICIDLLSALQWKLSNARKDVCSSASIFVFYWRKGKRIKELMMLYVNILPQKNISNKKRMLIQKACLNSVREWANFVRMRK